MCPIGSCDGRTRSLLDYEPPEAAALAHHAWPGDCLEAGQCFERESSGLVFEVVDEVVTVWVVLADVVVVDRFLGKSPCVGERFDGGGGCVGLPKQWFAV